jgi:hypothetical protein
VQLVLLTMHQRRCLAQGNSLSRMAPHLAESQHALIHDMIASKTTKAPPNSVGRPRSVTPPMLDALCEHLLEKPELYQEEMVLFLLDEFKVHVTTFSLARALNSIGWTKKTIRRVAKGRNADLRDLYLYNTSHIRLYQYVFVDESGCDKRIQSQSLPSLLYTIKRCSSIFDHVLPLHVLVLTCSSSIEYPSSSLPDSEPLSLKQVSSSPIGGFPPRDGRAPASKALALPSRGEVCVASTWSRPAFGAAPSALTPGESWDDASRLKPLNWVISCGSHLIVQMSTSPMWPTLFMSPAK